MCKQLINIIILVIFISCKNDRSIQDQGVNAQYNDSILKVVHSPKIEEENSESIVKEPKNEDFEFSDYWRKEAFKKTREYLASQISKNNCKLLGQSVYNPNRVKYIGGSEYSIRIVCRYDCNQNYENEVIFLVNALYRGNNQWNFDVEKQAFND